MVICTRSWQAWMRDTTAFWLPARQPCKLLDFRERMFQIFGAPAPMEV